MKGTAVQIVACLLALALTGCAPGVPPVHDARAPQASVRYGRLPQAHIQQVVRANFSSFRKCYEDGLGRDGNLRGRVVIKFVIDRDGVVSRAEDNGSDLLDPVVIRCIIAGFGRLHFMPPEGDGVVTVVYPVIFSPAPAPSVAK